MLSNTIEQRNMFCIAYYHVKTTCRPEKMIYKIAKSLRFITYSKILAKLGETSVCMDILKNFNIVMPWSYLLKNRY